MRIFYDWEFLDDGKTVEPIAGGYVAENGDELYVIVADEITISRAIRHPWLVDNVIPHLPIVLQRDGTTPVNWDWDEKHPDFAHVVGGRVAAERVRDFILAHSTRAADRPATAEGVELWAWYGAYDHVVQSQLWGSMVELPDGVPMYTNDLRQLVRQLGNPEIPVRAEPVPGSMLEHCPQAEHHSLMDAWDNMARYDWLTGKFAHVATDGTASAVVYF